MDRRTFLKTSGAAIAGTTAGAPAFAQSARSRTLIFVPAAPLTVLDPVLSPTTPTTAHSYLVFDQLYGIDSQYRPQPQMAEGHTVSDDGLTWNIRLRPGLKFHDGTPVLARDCVATINRLSKSEAYLRSMASYTDAVEAVDDRTIRIRLKKRFPVLDALAHPGASPVFIMPERIAMTDPTKAITEIIGSGPYKFLADEFNPGQKTAYARNDAYVPRTEKADAMSGGKIANFERVEWKYLADTSTAASALITGEVDWVEVVGGDIIPLLKREPTVRVADYDPFGFTTFMKFNTIQPPFNNVKLRQVVLSAMDQNDYNRAIMGDNLEQQKNCYAFFHCALPGIRQVAEKAMAGKKDYAKLQDDVKKAGYNGEKVIVINPVDIPFLAPIGAICADVLTKIGLNVELQSMNFGAWAPRRLVKEPVEKGGWSIWHANAPLSLLADPVVNLYVRGTGANGFSGWFDSPEVENTVAEWLAAPTPQARSESMDKLQVILLEQAPAVPMGAYLPQTGFRKEITGHLPMLLPLLYNLKRG